MNRLFSCSAPSLLFLLLLVCLSESVFSSSISPSPPHTRVRIIEVEDDYYDNDSAQTTPPLQDAGATHAHLIRRPCDYDPCVVQTAPCEQVSAQTGCLCPGLTGPESVPEPPELRRISKEVKGTLVQWCAPRSFVKFYEVSLKDQEVAQMFSDFSRSGVLPDVDFGDEVCVAAGNDAGVSGRACSLFEAPQMGHALLNIGVIAGVIGILVVVGLVLSVLLWRRRTCWKAEMGGAEGLGNPSYTSDGAL